MYKHLRQERFLQLLSGGFAEPPCYSCFVLFSLPEKDLSSLEETRLLGGRQRVFCLELAAVVNLALLLLHWTNMGSSPALPAPADFVNSLFVLVLNVTNSGFRSSQAWDSSTCL